MWHSRKIVSMLELPHVLRMCIEWFSYLLMDSYLVAICLFACSWQLVVAGYYYFHCLSDNQQWLRTKVEEDYLPLTQSTGRNGNVSSIICTYMSCIWDVRTPYLPFCAWSIAGEWLNSSIFHSDNNCNKAA